MASYLKPYHDAAAQHGPGFKATLWTHPETQQLRFRVISQMVFLTGKRVLDAGCGPGDFAKYLWDAGLFYKRFIGVDGVPSMIDHARDRRLPESEFVAADFVADPGVLATGRPQVVTISGSLNTMDDDTALALLESAWAATGETLVFNFLSDRCDPKAPPQAYPARRLPTMRLLDWALSETWSVTFRQDYFPAGHDATIAMRKPDLDAAADRPPQ